MLIFFKGCTSKRFGKLWISFATHVLDSNHDHESWLQKVWFGSWSMTSDFIRFDQNHGSRLRTSKGSIRILVHESWLQKAWFESWITTPDFKRFDSDRGVRVRPVFKRFKGWISKLPCSMNDFALFLTCFDVQWTTLSFSNLPCLMNDLHFF